MAKLTLNSTSTGSVSFDAPVTTENTTITVPAANAGMQVMTLDTAKPTTSGTFIDFTGIPSWAKRITVMFNGVSTNGGSIPLVQLGAGSITTSGYYGSFANGYTNSIFQVGTNSTGFSLASGAASEARVGHLHITLLSGTTWMASGVFGGNGGFMTTAGGIVLSGTLDRIRITTGNGTDTFDAGSVNILYEGY
jgi:hypothetical protein